jgi:hypothetical protein
MLTRANALMMLVQVGALAGVASALGTVLAGRRRVDIGTFAAMLGMAAVSLKGSTAAYLLVDGTEIGSAVGRGLALKFAVESVGWFTVVAFALIVSAAVMRWLYSGSDHFVGEKRAHEASGLPLLAGCDVPGVGEQFFGVPGELQTTAKSGIRHTVIALVVGLVAVWFFSGGLATRTIQHGQACFVVAAAVGIACYVAHRLAPVCSPLWSIMAVPLIAICGYLWASVRPAMQGLPPSIPSSDFLRVLPIQYITVGTAAAIAMFWQMNPLGVEIIGRHRRSAGTSVPAGLGA